jgi:superfamily II DNA or RNA helicase/HKD family nuclease
MPSFRRSSALPVGVYDEVLSERLEHRLSALQPGQAEVHALGDDAEVDDQLVALVRDAARIAIASRKRSSDKLAVAARILEQLGRDPAFDADELRLVPRLLRGIHPIAHGETVQPPTPPRGSLLASGLITNAQGESVLDHLASEFASADRIDLLCSFIKLSGLDRIKHLIERHRARGRPLRVLTTTYMRATDLKAVELLHRLGAEVRVSYDESHTRLHAKAWIFHRDSAYSTAYVGSSNLSHAAQTDGLEWNVRIAQAEQPELVDAMASVFDSYWLDDDKFEPFDGSEPVRARLARSLADPGPSRSLLTLDVEPKEWQKPILRELAEARGAGRHKNLVVAATGTGKTLIAAFDFEKLLRDEKVETLLFVAHRKEILEQARNAFRQVLGRPNFGELWVDGQRPVEFRHIFASVQSLDGAKLDAGHFHHVIVDEVHHAAARSYDTLLRRLTPRELVGLTATPERADGRLYEDHFPRPYVGNLRVWTAIPNVLVPFRYFVLDTEGVDLTDAKWNGGYVDSDLSRRLVTAADLWIRTVLRALRDHVARPDRVRALAFCVDKAHAAVVADRLTRDAGLTARALTDETPREERSRAKDDLLAGKVQVLCVVDLFNEGVDIPDVNTLFLLRPTESATVFLQQFGRGLRRARDKDVLTVFDLTGRQHPRFRFDRHLRALLGHSPRELRTFVDRGEGRLPSGCVVHFEERSQRDILERIKHAIPDTLRGIRELLQAHRDEGWTLSQFIEETEIDPLDLYRDHRSWASLRAEVGLLTLPTHNEELAALKNVQKLLEVDDPIRLDAWERFVRGEEPRTEAERRLAAMLFVTLYGRFEAARFGERFEAWMHHSVLRDEVRQLLPVLAARADSLPREQALHDDVPLMLHARYLDTELSAAFAATSKEDGRYRNFYTGVESVCGGRYDLLLVTLEKGDVTNEHLRYKDYPLTELLFHWQSQASTRQADRNGRRHLRPGEEHVTPLLLVRERKKDARGVTCAFRFLGAVTPERAQGERPISIEWRLGTPLRSEWVRRWGNVA